MNNPFLSLYGQGQAPQSVQNISTYKPSFAEEQAAMQSNMAAGRQTMGGYPQQYQNPFAGRQLPSQGPMWGAPFQQQSSMQQPYMQQSPNFAYINMLRQYMMNQQPQFQQQYRPQYQQPQYQRPFLFGTNMNSPIMRAPWFNSPTRQPLQPGQYGYGNGIN